MIPLRRTERPARVPHTPDLGLHRGDLVAQAGAATLGATFGGAGALLEGDAGRGLLGQGVFIHGQQCERSDGEPQGFGSTDDAVSVGARARLLGDGPAGPQGARADRADRRGRSARAVRPRGERIWDRLRRGDARGTVHCFARRDPAERYLPQRSGPLALTDRLLKRSFAPMLGAAEPGQPVAMHRAQCEQLSLQTSRLGGHNRRTVLITLGGSAVRSNRPNAFVSHDPVIPDGGRSGPQLVIRRTVARDWQSELAAASDGATALRPGLRSAIVVGCCRVPGGPASLVEAGHREACTHGHDRTAGLTFSARPVSVPE